MKPSRFTSSDTASSPAYQKAVAALRRLLRSDESGDPRRAFADAMHEARLAWFVKRTGFEPVEDEHGHVCVYRLIGEKCPYEKGESCRSPGMIPGNDHVSEWRKDGRTAAIVSQPYEVSYRDLREMVGFCEEFGLEVMISASSSWYFPGSTVMVEYRRKGWILGTGG